MPWLLDPTNPSVRLLTLRHVFKKPEESLEPERARLVSWTPIQSLLQHRDRVNFWGRSDNPYFGGQAGNLGTLYLLAQLGVPLFPELEPVCENLLNVGRRADGCFALEEDVGAPWLCYTGMALQTLWHFGYGDDLRARSARTALTQVILLRPELLACPIAGGSCRWGVVKALAALVRVPAGRRSADDEEAIHALSERLISHAFDFGGREADWLRPTFPRYYEADIVELCRVLAQTSCRTQHRFQELLQQMLALQTEEGRWCKTHATPVFAEERIHQPSRWLTFEAANALMMTYGDSIYAA